MLFNHGKTENSTAKRQEFPHFSYKPNTNRCIWETTAITLKKVTSLSDKQILVVEFIDRLYNLL